MPSLKSLVFMVALSAPTLAVAKDAAPNTLTPAEKKAGWRLLFDGKTTNGWRGLSQQTFPAAGWAVVDGTIKRDPAAGKQPGDIITVDEFDDFELAFEWKLAPGGNSGLKYLVDEALAKGGHGGLGFEYQILDDDKHPDAKAGKDGNRTVGSLYDLIPAARDKKVNPPGQWNETRLVVKGNHVEHWLDGKKVLEYERGSEAMKALIAASKYKGIKGFGENAKGHLLLQDHGNEVAFRNVKLRTLTAK